MLVSFSNGYETVDPWSEQDGVYWVAVNGQAMAVIPPDPKESCIAEVEKDMCALFGARGYSWHDIYVIWQPKNHTPANWRKWSEKWSKRTSKEPTRPPDLRAVDVQALALEERMLMGGGLSDAERAFLSRYNE